MTDQDSHPNNETPTQRLPALGASVTNDEASLGVRGQDAHRAGSIERWGADWGAHPPERAQPLDGLPTPIPARPGEWASDGRVTTARLDWGARLTILAALLLAGLALASNLVLLAALLRVQDAAVAGLDNAVAQMEGLCGPGTEPILFPISQTIRFKGDVAMPDNLVIPFKGNIPIKTTVRISIPGLPGGPTIEVPINTVVPVDTQVALPGGMRIPIDTQVPVRQVMPIDLCAPDSPVHGFLGQAIQELRTLRQSLSFP